MRQNKRFAAWLKKARNEAHLTQAQLAEYLDVAQATVHYWEDEGRLSMTPDEIRDLAVLLHVPPVEVADALGYPTQRSAVFTSPISEDELIERVAALTERLSQTVEAWAVETFPPQGGRREDNGRSGSRGG